MVQVATLFVIAEGVEKSHLLERSCLVVWFGRFGSGLGLVWSISFSPLCLVFLQSCEVVPSRFLSLTPFFSLVAHFLFVCMPTLPRAFGERCDYHYDLILLYRRSQLCLRSLVLVCLFSADKTECLNQLRSFSLSLSLSLSQTVDR